MNNVEKELFAEEAAREQFVISQFERAGLDIRRYPNLFERFKRLHNPPESKHFEDAAQMVDIIEAIWSDLETQLSFKLKKEWVILAALLHDIGKSGPADAEPAEQQLIINLFDPRCYQTAAGKGENLPETTILHALRDSNIESGTQHRIAKYLNRLRIDIVTEKMIDFWRRHADWTYDILRKVKNDEIDERLAVMAASHHILEGKNPANLDPENVPNEAKTIEIIEAYEVLTLIDQFQAYIKRSGKSHSEAIAELRNKINKQKLSDRVKGEYLAILGVLEKSEEKLRAKLKE